MTLTKSLKRGDRRRIKTSLICRDRVVVPGKRAKHREAERPEGDLTRSKKLVTCRKCNKTHPKGKDHKCGSNRLARLEEAKLRRATTWITDRNVPATAETVKTQQRRSKKKKLEEMGLTDDKSLKAPSARIKTVPVSDVIYD